jgi:thiol-disulfide isomerase/thioredoxin
MYNLRGIVLILVFGIFISCTGNDISNDAGSTAYERGRIYGQVGGLPAGRILLSELFGDEVNLLDSADAGPDGSFEFYFPPERERGLYRISLLSKAFPLPPGRQPQQFDLIWDGSLVVFRTHYASPVDSMRIISSEENKLYYQLSRHMNDFYRKMSVLGSALAHYPNNDNFYRRLERQYRRVQNRRSNYIDNMAKSHNGSIFASIARFHKMPRTLSPAGSEGFEEMKKEFFFEGQFSDPVLLRTDLIPLKLVHFLSLYIQNESNDPEYQQEEFIKAADIIMHHASENEEIYYYVLEYLINFFDDLQDMEPVTEHLTGRYLLGDVCIEEGRRVHRATSVNTGMKEGDRVPAFTFTASDGRVVNINDISAEYTVIFFWGTWCPHCDNIIDNLYDMYTRYKAVSEGFLEIVAIGIEDDEQRWRHRINTEGYRWINYSSFQKWDCPVAREYNITGTPTLILLDREKRFLQEPLRVRALDRYLSRQK